MNAGEERQRVIREKADWKKIYSESYYPESVNGASAESPLTPTSLPSQTCALRLHYSWSKGLVRLGQFHGIEETSASCAGVVERRRSLGNRWGRGIYPSGLNCLNRDGAQQGLQVIAFRRTSRNCSGCLSLDRYR